MQNTDKYVKSINIVVDYIDTNIDKKLDVHTLARLTSLSAYHFHRIFTMIMGETLAKYIMRRRLELAAIELQNTPQKPIMNIAFECGFNSVNVFCRNFKKHFEMTAEAYRSKKQQEHSKNSTFEHNMSQQSRSYSHYFCQSKSVKIGDKNMICNFEIKRLEDTYVVYCRHYGAYTNMQQSFEKVMRWAYPKGLINAPDFRLAAIYHDNPNVTEENKLISDACLIVKEPMKGGGEIVASTIKGGQYAVGRFEILWNEFQVAWECMYRLVDEYGFKCSGLPFEVYLNNSENHPEKKWVVDICIPVIMKQCRFKLL